MTQTSNTTSKFMIKSYDGSDVDRCQLTEIAKDWQNSQGFWSAESILESLRHPETKLWAAIDVQTLNWVGVNMMRLAPDDAELLYIHTSSLYRGQGIAQQMLQWAIAALKKSIPLSGSSNSIIKKVFLEVRSSNQPAQKLYKRLGFAETGRRKKYYKDGEDALIYEMALT